MANKTKPDAKDNGDIVRDSVDTPKIDDETVTPDEPEVAITANADQGADQIEGPSLTEKADPTDAADLAEENDTAADDVSDSGPVDEVIVEDSPVSSPLPDPIVERVIEKRSVFVPAIIGGFVAAGLGFAAAKSDLLDAYFPESAADQEVTALQQAVSDQSAKYDALAAQVSGIKIPDLSGLEGQMTALTSQVTPLATSISGLETQLATLNSQLTALDDRVTAVEKRPISEGVSQSAIDAYENELSKLQASMVKQRAEVEALIKTAKDVEAEANQTRENAAGVLKVAANKAYLADLRAAIDAGSPFADVLAQLSDNGVAIPAALTSVAATGVPTLAALQDAFPDQARAALATSRDDKTDTGLGAFIRRQLGARSVAPRDGTDADAVLSRAEAALTNGQVGAALDEIATLPDNVSAVLADWVGRAKLRQSANAAVDALGHELNTK